MRDCRSVTHAALIVLACVVLSINSAFAQGSSAPVSSSDPSPSSTTTDSVAEASAQSPNESSRPSPERQFLKNLLRDQRAIWTSPLHVKEGTPWRLVTIGAVSTALLLTDEQTEARLGNNSGRLHISNDVSQAGSWYGLAAVSGAFYLVGRAAHSDKARETGVLSAEALINGIVVGQALKAITQRKRPLDQPGEAQFFNGGSAFPSGHSINAWAVATVVAHEYDNLPAQLTAYGLASLVSISRFTGQRHYLSDIFIGGAIGYGIGRYVYRAHHDAALDASVARQGSRWRPAVSPVYSRASREYGLTLTWGL
jgi:membrane-associated phospholipid phosphatase